MYPLDGAAARHIQRQAVEDIADPGTRTGARNLSNMAAIQ